jgi:hypothetical protein
MDRATIPRDGPKGGGQPQPTGHRLSVPCRGGSPQPNDVDHGSQWDEHDRRAVLHDKPLLSRLLEPSRNRRAAQDVKPDRLADPSHQPIRQGQLTALVACPLRDLTGQLGSGGRVELRLQVVEQPLPSHGAAPFRPQRYEPGQHGRPSPTRTRLGPQPRTALPHHLRRPKPPCAVRTVIHTPVRWRLTRLMSRVDRRNCRQTEANEGNAMVPAVHETCNAGRRIAVAAAAAVAAVLSAAITVWLARLALLMPRPLTDADTASLLTAFSALACAVVVLRLTLSLAVVAVTSALAPDTMAHRRGRGVALALSPRWIRPAVALLLATGVTAASGACTRPPPAPALTLSAEMADRDRPIVLAPHEPAAWSPGSARTPGGSLSPTTHRRLSHAVPRTETTAFAGKASDSAGAAAASGPGPPGTGWLGMSVLPDPVWTALPEPGWMPSPPPEAPLLPAADAALVTSGAQRANGSLPRAARAGDDRVVVRRGDSLWSITARHLGPGASDAEVAAEWPRWWQANRSVIGPDPDLLLPGMRLRPPRQ